MKYCIRYTNDFRLYDLVDEIKIKLWEVDMNLLGYTQKIKQEKLKQRIIVDLTVLNPEVDISTDGELYNKLVLAKQSYRNLAVMIDLSQLSMVNLLKKYDIPFFFDLVVDHWDTLQSFCELGVSDVYIGNELGFDMMRVSEYCKRRKIRIRVYPNIAQNSSPIINYDVFNSFFIRPEDQIQYEGLIDVLEFYGDLDKQEVYLSIYRNDQEWNGFVSDIIIGYIGEVMNNAVVPTFGQKRTHCRKECIKPDGESCHICEEAYELAKAINEKGLEIEGMEKLPKNWRDKKRAKKILKKFIKNDRTEFENLLGENFEQVLQKLDSEE